MPKKAALSAHGQKVRIDVAFFAEFPATFRIAGTALRREVGYGVQHEGNGSLVAHIPSFSFHGDKAALRQRLQVKRQIGGGNVEQTRNISGDKAVGGVFHEQPEHVKTHVRREGFEYFAGMSAFHGEDISTKVEKCQECG